MHLSTVNSSAPCNLQIQVLGYPGDPLNTMTTWCQPTVNPIPAEFPKLYIKAKQKVSTEWAGIEVSMEKKLWTETDEEGSSTAAKQPRDL